MRAVASATFIRLTAAVAAMAQNVEGRSGDSIVLTVSRETTFLTEPVDDEGWVDYSRGLEAQLSQGVTPENNAAVLWWQALGPDEIPLEKREDFFRRLGAAPLPDVGEYFVDLGGFAVDPPEGVNPDDWMTTLNNQQSEAMMRPWTRQEFPAIARWVDLNEPSVKVVARAAQRPRYFSPLLHFDDSTLLFNFRLPHAQMARSVARALLARSMLRLAEGNIDGAWSDLVTTHRLARMIARGPTLIELLVGAAIESMACAGEGVLLKQDPLTADQARSFLTELQALPDWPDIAQTMNLLERDALLDVYSHVVRARDANLFFTVTDSPEIKQIFTRLLEVPAECDWDEPMRVCNRWHDRAVQAMSITSRRQRMAELNRLNDELRALRDSTTDSKILEDRLAIADRKERGAIIGELLTATLMTSFVQAREAQDRVTARIRLSRLGMALVCHRSEQGNFPANLGELRPAIAEPGLTDPFTDKAFVYKPDENGFVLYSLGSNEQDDGGRTYGEAEGVDDLVVRVPAR
jgi:hypothetical protein